MGFISDFKSLDDYQALDFRDLGNVSGGRSLTQNEISDADSTTRKYAGRKDRLKKEGHTQKARELEMKYFDLYSDWLQDIGDAPEGSDDILLSSYLDPYL